MKSRKFVTIAAVGTSWIEASITNLPDKIVITRAIAHTTSGTATELALRVSQRSNPSEGSDQIILEYDLVTTLDYTEEALAIPFKRRDIDLGTMYVAVKADTTGNTCKVTLEYQIV